MMAELRKLHRLLSVLGVRSDAHWLPLTVNRHADALSRTCNPSDLKASVQLLDDIKEQYGLGPPAFCTRPLNEPLPARLKQIGTQMQEWWGDGRAGIMEPSFRLSSPRHSEDTARGGTGRALGAILARAGMVRAISVASDYDPRPERARRRPVFLHEDQGAQP